MKAFKAFMKPFEAPQRGAKIKIQANFHSSFDIGTAGAKSHYMMTYETHIKFLIRVKKRNRFSCITHENCIFIKMRMAETISETWIFCLISYRFSLTLFDIRK